MSKHTPGPWKFYDDSSDGKTNRIEIVAIGKTVARIYHSVPSEDLPNARLIAAAPDLLEQLKIARREIAALSQAYIAMITNQATGLIDDPDHALIAQADRDMLNGFDAAIAKAEGQQ